MRLMPANFSEEEVHEYIYQQGLEGLMEEESDGNEGSALEAVIKFG